MCLPFPVLLVGDLFVHTCTCLYIHVHVPTEKMYANASKYGSDEVYVHVHCMSSQTCCEEDTLVIMAIIVPIHSVHV